MEKRTLRKKTRQSSAHHFSSTLPLAPQEKRGIKLLKEALDKGRGHMPVVKFPNVHNWRKLTRENIYQGHMLRVRRRRILKLGWTESQEAIKANL